MDTEASLLHLFLSSSFSYGYLYSVEICHLLQFTVLAKKQASKWSFSQCLVK